MVIWLSAAVIFFLVAAIVTMRARVREEQLDSQRVNDSSLFEA